MKTIAFDVDGVLCDFGTSYRKLAADFDDQWALTKGIPHTTGLSKTWDHIWSSNSFWAMLPPLIAHTTWMRIRDIEARDDTTLYFITHRQGHSCQLQTAKWLQIHGLRHPTVLLSHDKAPILKGLGTTHYIDDLPRTVQKVRDLSPTVQAYIVTRPYNMPDSPNEWYRPTPEMTHLPRLNSVNEFLDAIDR